MNSSLKGRGEVSIKDSILSLEDRLDLAILLMDTGLTDPYVKKSMFNRHYKKFKSLVKTAPSELVLDAIDDFSRMKGICTKVKKILKDTRVELEG